jgi:hypothetical protein
MDHAVRLLRHSLFHSLRFKCSSLRSIEISEFSSYLFSVALAVIGKHTMGFAGEFAEVLQLALGGCQRSAALFLAFLLTNHSRGLLPVFLLASLRAAIGFPKMVCPFPDAVLALWCILLWIIGHDYAPGDGRPDEALTTAPRRRSRMRRAGEQVNLMVVVGERQGKAGLPFALRGICSRKWSGVGLHHGTASAGDGRQGNTACRGKRGGPFRLTSYSGDSET